MIGETVDHYRITQKLGEGGMGEVYLAEDTSLERKVALKFLPLYLQQDSTAHKRFLREAKSAAAIDHPYICNIFEVAHTKDGQEFIVMEYVDGVTLQEKLVEGPLSLPNVVRIASQVSDALELAHQKGIVHRDLKPANIMLTQQGHVKVMDFGLAKRVTTAEGGEQDITQGLTREGTTLGTLAYMSPEQLRGESVDARSDLFSFGIVLYEMLTAVHPFRKPQSTETIGALLRDDPAPLTQYREDVPEVLEHTLAKMLAKDPSDRSQSVQDVATELNNLSDPSIQTHQAAPFKIWGGLLLVLAGVLILAVLGWWAFRQGTTSIGPDAATSIAVLPLANLSGDPDQDYFADGLTEALITDLGKIGALRVISRTSVMRYKGTDQPLAGIAKELNVDNLVEGSAQRVGQEAGITVRLIDAVTEGQIWSESYQRDLSNLLTLQSELARAIAEEIEISLSPEEETFLSSPRPVNPQAHEAYLKGRFHWYKMTHQDLGTALKYFKLATEKDQDFALAYVGYADALATPAHIGLIPSTEVFPEAKRAVLKALELDDTLAEAHDFLARIHFTWDWDWEAAEREFQRALELNPNYPDVHVVYSQFLALTGRWDDVIMEVERALNSDPHNAFYQHQLGARLAELGRYDDAIIHFQKMLKTDPNAPSVRLRLWELYGKKEMYEEALEEAETYFVLIGKEEVSNVLTRGYEEGGYSRAMELAGDKLAALSRETYVGPVTIAQVYAHAGLEEQALDWLERSYQERESRLVYAKVDPIFENLRNKPRFHDLLRQMNLEP